MSRGQKRVLKFVNFFVQNLQKPHMIDLVTHSMLICDALWSICHLCPAGDNFLILMLNNCLLFQTRQSIF